MHTHQTSLRTIRWGCALLTALAVASTSVIADDLPINIQCSPSVVNLGSVASGDWMTVHTDLQLSALGDPESVWLHVATDADGNVEGSLPAVSVYPDNRGNLVAKFNLTDLKAMLEPGSATLKLTLITVDALTAAGFDEVKVVNPPSLKAQKRYGQPGAPGAGRGRKIGKIETAQW